MPNLIITDQAASVSYTATSGQTVFTYNFPIFQAEDLKVFVDGVAYTEFTIAGVGDADGGEVTLDAAPATGATVALSRNVPVRRDTDLPATGPYSSEDIDYEFDRAFAVMQQQKDELGRTPKVPVGEVAPRFLSLVGQGGKVLAVVDDGNDPYLMPIANDVAEAVDAVAAAELARNQTAVLKDATATIKAETLTIKDDTDDIRVATEIVRDAAEAFSDEAKAAALASGFFPGARSFVPQGATGAGTIVGGSGGTNGTFALLFSGGNFSVAPTGTFTVAGGALTAVTITGPGLYVGGAISAPTPVFTNSAGLTGASAVLTTGFLITSGTHYLTDHATDVEQVSLFQNVAGVATQIDPSIDWLNIAAARGYANAASASAGNLAALGFVLGQPIETSTSWAASINAPVFNVNSTYPGGLYIQLLTTAHRAIVIEDILVVGQRYRLAGTGVRLSGSTYPRIQFGNFVSSLVVGTDAFYTPTAPTESFVLEFEARTTDFYLGALSGDMPGDTAFGFDNFTLTRLDAVTAALLESAENEAVSIELFGSTSTDRTMNGSNNWANQVGAPIQGVNQVGYTGKLRFAVTPAENRSMELPNVLTIGKEYLVLITMSVFSGTTCQVSVGEFSSAASGPGFARFTPTPAEDTYALRFSATTTYFAFGARAADTQGLAPVFDINEINIIQLGSDSLQLRETLVGGGGDQSALTPPIAYGTEGFLQSVSRRDKALTKICIAGDSLVANDTGGNVPAPFDEGLNAYPIRLDCNNIARQLYDQLSWNKPTHRQVAHSDWTKSGTWTAVNDTTIWEPPHAFSNYHESTTAGAYLEITVPNGKENFGLIVQEDAAFGSLTVTLNGGSISAYGSASIALARTRLGTGDNGNPYKTYVYEGLPAGANVIRVTKTAGAAKVRVWGVFYWSGNTLMIYNVGHGNHQMAALLEQGHFEAEVLENDFDAVIFQTPLMNEVGTVPIKTAAQSSTSLQTILTDLADKDVLFWSAWPFGTDPVDATPNYYALYTTPTMEETNTALTSDLFTAGIPYVDVFRIFKMKIEKAGGTLAGGEGGYTYTTDGQHANLLTNQLVTDMLMSTMRDKPIGVA